MTIYAKILTEIKILYENKREVSVISMKIYYIILEHMLKINTNKGYNHDETKIYEISSLCADNIECILKNAINLNFYYTIEEITDMIYKLIITNIKYL
jgi:hypothetical protein